MPILLQRFVVLAKLVDCIVVAFALVDDFATLNFDNQFFILHFVQVLIVETGFLRYERINDFLSELS